MESRCNPSVKELRWERTSAELIESGRVKYGAQKGIDTWIRPDHENYSYVNKIV